MMYRGWGKALFLVIIALALLSTFKDSHRSYLLRQLSSIQNTLPTKWLSTDRLSTEKYLETTTPCNEHPIEILVRQSNIHYQKLLDQQNKTLQQVISGYRSKYHRDPPQGFDVWFNLTRSNNCIFIDDTYDGIVEDLRPFGKLSVRDIQQRLDAVIDSKEWIVPFEIIDGKSAAVEPNMKSDLIRDWITEYAEYLPDMRIPYDILPEPRIAVPWEKRGPETTCQEKASDARAEKFEFLTLDHKRPYGHAISPCPPKSAVRGGGRATSGLEDSLPLTDNAPSVAPEHLRFVNNVPLVKDICENPELEVQNGLLVSPDTMRLSTDLLPLFSRDRLSSFQDILVPTPAYGEHFSSDNGEMAWDDKNNDLYWVGTTTGGYHHNGSWKLTQRFRFVSLLNDPTRPIRLMRAVQNKSWETHNGLIADIAHLADVKFTKHKLCAEEDCAAQKADPTLRFGEVDEFDEVKKHRLVIDLDGQASTDRFYRLMRSNSTVLKQTICQEWHDPRLMPWVHYIPVSMHMEELPELIRFLTEEDRGREIARDIATQGRQFAHTALRNVDMGLYLFRLLLEWGRILDPERDKDLPVCMDD